MKISYETHFKSSRPDGRHVSTMASFYARLRTDEMENAYKNINSLSDFENWRDKLINAVEETVKMPQFSSQPDPLKLSSVQRDGYRVERWEFYPDEFTAVPFLILIPDGVNKENKAPGVLCFPGSIFSKEFIADEPLLESPKCSFSKYPERNKMAKYIVKNNMVAFAFENPETAECALEIENESDWGSTSRVQMSYGLLQYGYSYFGISLFQKLCFLKYMDKFEFVDQSRLGVSAHSLGCDDAMYLALLKPQIKAVVFNDLVCDEKHRYFATTEFDERSMPNFYGTWHIIPGIFKSFSRPDILCSLAPKYLALNEGGAEYYLDKIRDAYKINGAEDRLQITHYPKFKDKRSDMYEPALEGFSEETFFEFTNTHAPDHSYREEPSINLLRKAFFNENNAK